MKTIIGQQGEVMIIKLDHLPTVATKPTPRSEKGFIISHSESGHHHLLLDGDVMERTENIPAGMQIFYALLDKPTEFVQDSANPHGGYMLEPGSYEFRISREFDPFAEQVRKVAD